VTDFSSGDLAIEAAKAVKSLQKRVEAKRRELVAPLNDRVKEINDYAKEIALPLEKAETYLKQELAAFEIEQAKIRLAAREKAEKERREREAELLAKQEAERAALEEAIAYDSEVAELFGTEPDATPVDQKAKDLEQKQLEERARAAQAAKDREYEIKQQGIKNARKTWKCEVVDISLVPKEFLIVTLNQSAVLAAARGGMTNIPGVKLWQETSVAIGANTRSLVGYDKMSK
jgi:hypothetical protein